MSDSRVIKCQRCKYAKSHHREEVNCPRQGWIKVNSRDSAFAYRGAGVCIWKEGGAK